MHQIINSLSIALGERDQGTRMHSDRVIGLSRALGIQISLSTQEIDMLCLGARFHDIGKIGIPDQVLHKPSRFDQGEWETMKQHPLIGERIVLAIEDEFAPQLAAIVRHHHEKFDGSGYPDHLQGTDIPLFARIVSLADNYDAMAVSRPYHPARAHHEVMDILSNHGDGKFDPDLLHAFEHIIEQSDMRAP
jgi:HD-GYP domain-containing protein (c-di-GMP phosphodiesterase class II)